MYEPRRTETLEKKILWMLCNDAWHTMVGST